MSLVSQSPLLLKARASAAVPSQILADLAVACRLERAYHDAVAESDWTAVHLVAGEVYRRIGRVEGALNFRVPVQPATHCARCLTLLDLDREIERRFLSRIPVGAGQHQHRFSAWTRPEGPCPSRRGLC
jgi:hypothetical protein